MPGMHPLIPNDIDEYISQFPSEVQAILKKIRSTIRKAAPEATEAISYQIPTFKLNNKNLIHFAAFKNHVSVYPAPRSAPEFETELAKYKGGKGTIRFPLDEKVPFEMISRIAHFLVRYPASKKTP
jgi:uncharacterized protein YdhG (YjbR/CyaY superfamily)